MSFLQGFHDLEAMIVGENVTTFRGMRAVDLRPVLCKVLNRASQAPDVAASLDREYGFLRRLVHPGIVEALDLHKSLVEDRLILVLGDGGGMPLARQIERGPLSLDAFFTVAIALVDALSAIHGAGIVHKNISPSVVLWDPSNGTVKLTDFSIASELSREEPSADAIEGSLAYMAPEQTGRINQAVDYRTDFYALGATFHTLLTGRPPYAATDPLELIHCHIARMPLPVHQVNPAVPEILSAIVAWLMAKDPENRCQSGFGLRADLVRCRDEWLRHGAIHPFRLGSRDRRPVLRVPQRVYGRGAERALLIEALHRAAEGRHEVVLLGGGSGVGKTTLVMDLRQPVAARHGRFLAGKFEPLRRDIPYAPIIDAIGQLIAQVVAAGGEQAGQLGARLAAALGDQAGVVAEVIPQLERLIGPCPSPSLPVGPVEAQNRFIYLFCKTMAALSFDGRPNVLFLDDLQWADLSSLQLIEAMARHGDLGHLLVVGAYRDNEVTVSHPLHSLVTLLTEGASACGHVRLAGLDEFAITQLVADTVGNTLADPRPLAAFLYSETRGNPFFVRQYLDALDRARLISFDHGAGLWTWDMQGIRRHHMGEDLTDLLASRICELPSDAIAVLKMAACIGSVFELSVLATVVGRPAPEAAALLWPVMKAGLIMPVGGSYRSVVSNGSAEKVSYRFVHDRIEQAVYSLLDEADALATHRAIGQSLLSVGGEGKRLFDVVYQLNRAISLLSPAERLTLAELNLRAGRAARAVVAVASARHYLGMGLALLSGKPWKDAYALTFALHLDAAEMAVWAGDGEEAVRLAEAALARAATSLDQAAVLDVLIQLKITEQKADEAVAVGQRALDLLGVPLPDRAERTAFFVELQRTRLAASAMSAESLAANRPADDPRALAIGRILFRCAAPAYFARPELFGIIVCRSVRLCLNYGNTPWAASSYAYFGVVLAGRLGNYADAGRFGRAALTMGGSPQALFMAKAFIEPWLRSIDETWPGLLDAHHQLMGRGDFLYATLSTGQIINQKLFSGAPLAALRNEAAAYRAVADQANQPTSIAFFKVFQQTIANLLGETPHPAMFSGPHLDGAQELETLTAVGNRRAVWQVHTFLAYLNFVFGRLDEALHHVNRWRELPVAALGQVADLRHAAVGCLIDFACWSRFDRLQRLRRLGDARIIERRLRRAAKSPSNGFAALARLVAAERHRALGHLAKAEQRYQQAIIAARSLDQPHNEGLAAERAGDLAQSQGDLDTAEFLLQRARHAYQQWGATAKVDALTARLAGLSGETAGRASTLRRRRPGSLTVDGIDVGTVIRASQALAEQIRLPDLLKALMGLVMANAGASRACLLLEDAGTWRIAAVDAAEDSLLLGRSLATLGSALAKSVIEAVIGGADTVVLEDASTSSDFLDDPYVARTKPRSILCLPLRNRSRLTGILYLENNLATSVFCRARVDLLTLISTQIAISIENARLYAGLTALNNTLEQQVAERTKEAEAARVEAEQANRSKSVFLASVGHDLRQPAQAILLLTSALRNQVREDHPSVKIVDHMENAVTAFQHILESLLDISRLDAGVVHAEPVLFDLAPLVAHAVEMARLRATGRPLQVVGEAAELRVYADPKLLARVIGNLMDNAVKYTPQGEVRIRCYARDGMVMIEVRDTGPGIPVDRQKAIFEEFFQLGNSERDRAKGLGLGLAIVRRLVLLMGGQVSVTCGPEGGSCFWVEVPAAPIAVAGVGVPAGDGEMSKPTEGHLNAVAQ